MLNKEETSREMLERAAKPLFGRLIYLYQMALLLESWDETSSKWVDPALKYMLEDYEENGWSVKPQTGSRIDGLIGWEY